MSSRGASELLLTVRFLDGRYHGQPEWPPAPARLFQALVAGSARGGRLEPEDAAALEWLECLPPPVVGAPTAWPGRSLKLWVPNNDLDSKGGDPADVSDIRTGKTVRPMLFDASVPLLYAWRYATTDEDAAARVASLARELHQLGRGVDSAWAVARRMPPDDLAALLEDYEGQVDPSSPGAVSKGNVLAVLAPARWRVWTHGIPPSSNAFISRVMDKARPRYFGNLRRPCSPWWRTMLHQLGSCSTCVGHRTRQATPSPP